MNIKVLATGFLLFALVITTAILVSLYPKITMLVILGGALLGLCIFAAVAIFGDK